MLKKKIAISIISVSVMAGTGIAAIPLLSRMLSAENLGRFFAFLGLISLLQVLDGLRPAIVFNINKRLQSEKNYREVFAEINRRFNYWVVPSLILILVLFTDFEPKVIALLSITYVAYTMMSLEWGLLEAKNDVNYPAITRALAWFLAYVSFVILAYCQIDISYSLVVMVVMYFLLWKLYHRRVDALYGGEKSANISSEIKKNIWLDVVKNIRIQFGAVLLTSADKIIIPQMSGYSIFSHYAIQAELATKGYVINSTVRRAIQPSYTITQGKDIEKLVGSGVLLFYIALIAVWLTQFFAEYLLVLYAGPQYAAYAYLLPALLLVFPANILGSVGTTILHARGDFKVHSNITAVGALLFVPLLMSAMYFQGIVGAVFVLALSRMVDVCTFFWSIFDKCSERLRKAVVCGLWFVGYVVMVSSLMSKDVTMSVVSLLFILGLTFATIKFFIRIKNNDDCSA